MSESKVGNALFGGIIGLVLGIFVGEHRVAELAAEHGEIAPTGLNPLPYMVYARFWVVVVICTLVFGFIVGRIGRRTSESDM
jgi:uncharacterized protein YneF (UPF0154 family)